MACSKCRLETADGCAACVNLVGTGQYEFRESSPVSFFQNRDCPRRIFPSDPIPNYRKMRVASIAILYLAVGLLPGVLSRNFASFHGVLTSPHRASTVLVVHGNDVDSAEKYPWQVFIELNNGTNQCGGSLIANEWILSAAHCFDGGSSITKIVMGTVRKNGNSDGAVFGTAEKVLCHKNYDTETLDYDICLVKLHRPVMSGPNLRPIALPMSQTHLVSGTTCSVTGWGYDEDWDLPNILQEAEVKIVDRDVCVAWHEPQTTVVNNTICAGHEEGGQDSCNGDSGGPLVCKDHSDKWILAGITSYGAKHCGLAKAPGIYTSVSKYLEWINDNLIPKTHWSSWSVRCSVTCGRGLGFATRFCLTETGNIVDDRLCVGLPTKTVQCDAQPCPAKEYIGIVVDNRGSMKNVISGLSDWITECTAKDGQKCAAKPNTMMEWLSISFNDREVGVVTGPTPNANLIKQAFSRYLQESVEGDDCQTLGMSGIKKLVESVPTNNDGCRIFFFSDGQAKDLHLLVPVFQLVLEKGCKYDPILTGCCGPCPSHCTSTDSNICVNELKAFSGAQPLLLLLGFRNDSNSLEDQFNYYRLVIISSMKACTICSLTGNPDRFLNETMQYSHN